MAGIPTAALDVMYHEAPMNKENYMDILTSSGMGLLVGYMVVKALHCKH